MKLNYLSELELFRKTCLYEMFRDCPLGFVDVGASGGIHQLINPMVSLVHCTSFEPDTTAYNELLERYKEDNPFAGISIYNAAVGGSKGLQSLYMTKSMVNTSLLEPNKDFASRYGVNGLEVVGVCDVQTNTLDGLFYNDCNDDYSKLKQHLAEFVKLDCQGVEYDILQGASRTLNEQTSVLYVEVEFTKLYREQKTFSDVDLLLKEKGYSLYGLYPHYISSKRLDRRNEDTEERMIWADALYFKDPLDTPSSLKLRDIAVILISALLTHYYDYALELNDRFFTGADAKTLATLIHSLSNVRRSELEKDVKLMLESVKNEPQNAFLHAKKFIDKNSSNSNIDYIEI